MKWPATWFRLWFRLKNTQKSNVRKSSTRAQIRRGFVEQEGLSERNKLIFNLVTFCDLGQVWMLFKIRKRRVTIWSNDLIYKRSRRWVHEKNNWWTIVSEIRRMVDRETIISLSHVAIGKQERCKILLRSCLTSWSFSREALQRHWKLHPDLKKHFDYMRESDRYWYNSRYIRRCASSLPVCHNYIALDSQKGSQDLMSLC